MERITPIATKNTLSLQIIIVRRCIVTIFVSKEEADVLRFKIHGVKISKTMCGKGSKRGKRYAEPTTAVIKVLKELRQTDYIEV